MIIPPKPANEESRLKALSSYQLLDTPSEDSYNVITDLACNICDTPIALVTLLASNRNFFKAKKGMKITETPRSISLCAHAILNEDPIFIVEDTRQDVRFSDNPFVIEFDAVFYAGVPLRTSDGFVLGTLCVYDSRVRTLTDDQQRALIGLANQVLLLFEARKRNIELEQSKAEIEKRNDRLKDFANLVAHDLKSPLASIEGIIALLKFDFPEEENKELATYLELLKKSSKGLRDYIEGLLQFYKTDILLQNKQDTSISEIIGDLRNIYPQQLVNLKVDKDMELINISKLALQQILGNLIDNGLKYNRNSVPSIIISGTCTGEYYKIAVSDNGVGVPEDKSESIFELFKTTVNTDKQGHSGNGMGLATVRKIVRELGGTIRLKSSNHNGSTFIFTIKR